MSPVVQSIPLELIIVDDENQPRVEQLDQAYINELATIPDLWPPVVVVAANGGRYILVDGFHRIGAAQQVGMQLIPATVLPMPADCDLLRLGFELNAAHGKPLTVADRKDYAQRLLAAGGSLSDREIGRRAGLHHETVGALRRGGQSYAGATASRRPGGLPSSVSLLDPLRYSGATRAQKATAGYLKRLAIALADPYEDELPGWSDDPADVSLAIVAAMGADRATQLFENMAADATFIVDVCTTGLHK
jgi:ParB-like chromosome segregation protein Spo0J